MTFGVIYSTLLLESDLWANLGFGSDGSGIQCDSPDGRRMDHSRD